MDPVKVTADHGILANDGPRRRQLSGRSIRELTAGDLQGSNDQGRVSQDYFQ